MPSFNYIRNSSKDIYKPNTLYAPKTGSVVVLEDTTLNVVLEENVVDVVVTATLQYGGTLEVVYNSIKTILNNGESTTIAGVPGTSLTIQHIADGMNSSGYITDSFGLNDYYYTSSGVYTYTITSATTLSVSLTVGCCVPYYSQIMLADNTTKSAEDVKVGDIILGYNETNNTYQDVEVLGIIKKLRNDMCKVIFEDDTYLEITADHPILTDYGWSAYQPETSVAYESMGLIHQLTTQQKVLQLNGEYKQIKELQLNILEQPMDVYTFNTTEGVDTYIAENCVVHNALECGGVGGDDEIIEDTEQM